MRSVNVDNPVHATLSTGHEFFSKS